MAARSSIILATILVGSLGLGSSVLAQGQKGGAGGRPAPAPQQKAPDDDDDDEMGAVLIFQNGSNSVMIPEGDFRVAMKVGDVVQLNIANKEGDYRIKAILYKPQYSDKKYRGAVLHVLEPCDGKCGV